jgi:hypothetical protein
VISSLVPKLDGRWNKEKKDFVNTITTVLEEMENLHNTKTEVLEHLLNEKMKPTTKHHKEMISTIIRSFHSNKV